MNRAENTQMLIVTAHAPSLALKLLIGYLRMKRRAKRTGEVFSRTLIQNGISRADAGRLTEVCTSMVCIRYGRELLIARS